MATETTNETVSLAEAPAVSRLDARAGAASGRGSRAAAFVALAAAVEAGRADEVAPIVTRLVALGADRAAMISRLHAAAAPGDPRAALAAATALSAFERDLAAARN